MVKQTPPESPQISEEAQQEDFSTAHPLMRNRSQTGDLLEAALKRQDANDFKIKEVAEWKQCVNGLASTPNGRMFIRSMIQYAGYNDPPAVNNPNKMVTNTIKGSFYLTWVRPYLTPEVRKELE